MPRLQRSAHARGRDDRRAFIAHRRDGFGDETVGAAQFEQRCRVPARAAPEGEVFAGDGAREAEAPDENARDEFIGR